MFNNNLFEENQNNFLEFLRNLLKDQPYVLFCYMTGVLPIKKYSSGSALNMFDEHTFLKDRQFGEFFGFTEKEVINLVDKNSEIKFEDLESWYNGYLTAKGIKIYNPRSVVKALQNDYCESYWTNTGEPRTKEEIYSAMIVLGFLSYYDGYLKIPNKELMKEFEKALRDMLILLSIQEEEMIRPLLLN